MVLPWGVGKLDILNAEESASRSVIAATRLPRSVSAVAN